MASSQTKDFYVANYEHGAYEQALPAWASGCSNPAALASTHARRIKRADIASVPGAFWLFDVLSEAECQSFIALSESLGYHGDAAVSLPREVRHNDNMVWVVDERTDEIIWQRIAQLIKPADGNHKAAVGINARFRFYRYQVGDFFKPHTDGAWPGSRVINRQLVNDAYGDRYSQMSFLIFLNDQFEGGATRFYINANDRKKPAFVNDPVHYEDIKTPKGSVLCFPHGTHPLHCRHSSEAIKQGVKYIIRTDVLFTR